MKRKAIGFTSFRASGEAIGFTSFTASGEAKSFKIQGAATKQPGSELQKLHSFPDGPLNSFSRRRSSSSVF